MYKLNTQLAKEADRASNRITETGEYVGVFKRAQHVVYSTGTKGIIFDFVTLSGEGATFTIYTESGQGEQLHGLKLLNAILTVLKIKNEINPVIKPATFWDFDTKSEVKKDVEQFIELLDKPIGILVQKEEYEKIDENKNKTGETAWRPVMRYVFSKLPECSDFMAKEILDKASKPELKDKIIQTLKDRPLNNTSFESKTPSPKSHSENKPSNLEEDIPF